MKTASVSCFSCKFSSCSPFLRCTIAIFGCCGINNFMISNGYLVEASYFLFSVHSVELAILIIITPLIFFVLNRGPFRQFSVLGGSIL